MGVQLNHTQIDNVASVLKGATINPDFLGREFLHFNADRETKLRVYFLSAAICHQTRTLQHPELNLYGWEYMEYGFLQLLHQKNPLLNPGYLSICSNQDVEGLLKQTFSPDGNPENCTLDRIEERSLMLLDICRIVKARYGSRISTLIDNANGFLVNNGKGLYEILSAFMGFSDPQKKKITFFIKLAMDAGVINIKDTENLIPIMDYHMQRVLLRTGCVVVDDPDEMIKLRAKTPVLTDEPIRGKCIAALRLLSKKSGLELLSLNDIFWPLGRSCCHETTLCTTGTCAKTPCTLTQTLSLKTHEKCLLQEVCIGSLDESVRSLYEPFVETHYY
ncbi:MAG TPA: hypothetical protein P5514_01735 [Bacteroidales bacterium]|nr:hypothetical protein [Bacteroidales bacterium]HRX95639.1 hypothetical protein [Bacteroidales bacterium]